jgi:hypothetical protein
MATDEQGLQTTGLSDEELEAQQASALPDREAMTLLDLDSLSLLDLDVNIDAAIDGAAPIGAAVAANANVAAPIDAAVAANIGSVGSTAYASADQDAAINQVLDGVATATADQDSTVNQGGD